MRRPFWIFAAFLVLGLWFWSSQRVDPSQAATPAAVFTAPPPAPLAASPARYPAFLPEEAHAVLQQIARGGPFANRQDGSVFQNRERHLPAQPRGYYHEYTVATPGSPDRGARRIITGGEPPQEYWYTDDHYRSFHRFEVAP